MWNDFTQDDSSNIYSTVTDPIALICSEALYGLQQAWKPARGSCEHLTAHICKDFSITGSTVSLDFIFFFLKQTTIFSIFLLNLAAWQVTSPTTNNWPSKTEAGMSSTHVTGMNPNGPVAPSQPNSRKQKWFPAPLEGTAGGSLCLHWFNKSVKLQQGIRWQWW